MSIITQIKMPSGNVYDIADAYARQLLGGGLQFVVCWDGTSTPVVANIPYGVTVTYNGTDYTGTKAASTAEALTFYLVRNSEAAGSDSIYAEYVSIRHGSGTTLDPYTYTWEKIGDTSVDLGNLGTLAYKNTVTLSKGSGDQVLGESTTFSTTVTPTTTKLVTTTGKLVTGSDTATLVSNEVSKKLITTSVPNVTSAGTASTWSFTMGSDNSGNGGSDESTTLIISGGNGTAAALGTAITVATGSLADTTVSTNVGGTVVSSFSTTTKTLATTNLVDVTLATGSVASDGGGATVATGITSASTSAGTNDKVIVAVYSDLGVSVS